MEPEILYKITVLGKPVEVCDIDELLRMGNTSDRIQCSSVFTVYNRFAKEMLLKAVIKLQSLNKKGSTNSFDNYIKADKHAINFILKKYGKNKISDAFISYHAALKTRPNELNYNRLKLIAEHLKISKVPFVNTLVFDALPVDDMIAAEPPEPVSKKKLPVIRMIGSKSK